MKRLIILLIIAAVGWYGYDKYHDRLAAQTYRQGGSARDARAGAGFRELGEHWRRRIQVRRPYALFANDFLGRSDVLSEELSRHENGREQ